MTGTDKLKDLKTLSARLLRAVSNLSPQRKKVLEDLLADWERVECRQDPRIACFLPVDYTNPNRVYQDFINNLSRGGLFIETAASLRTGQPLTLTFTVPNLQQPFKLSGVIVRTDKNGIGVKFSPNLTVKQIAMIHEAIGPK